MDVIEIQENDRDYWDSEIVKFAIVHPLNAFGWGLVRAADGWRPHYYLAKENERVAGMIMVLEKKIPLLGISIMYAPKGPVWDPTYGSGPLTALFSKIHEDSRRSGAIFLRIDPNLQEEDFTTQDDPFVLAGFKHLEHRWSFWNSPRDVSRIDLTKASDVEGLFNTIDKDARRCIRKAAKEGVTIRSAENQAELRQFYEIFSRFSVNKGFMSRAYEYQESLWKQFIAKGHGNLFLATFEGNIIGGLICLLFGNKCLAMHMGTPYEYHKLQTNYAYLWESIKWAKEMGCVWYSFRGTGTTLTQESFKNKFDPQHVSLVGYYDVPYKPRLYKIVYFCEFEVLPRLWRSAMKLRKLFKLTASNI